MSFRTCRECRNNSEHYTQIREYRSAKQHHKKQADIANTFGSFVAIAGFAHTFLRTLDTWNLPTRMHNAGGWDKPMVFQQWVLGDRRANFIVSGIFGVTCMFWAKAWHHQSQAILYKEKLKEYK